MGIGSTLLGLGLLAIVVSIILGGVFAINAWEARNHDEHRAS